MARLYLGHFEWYQFDTDLWGWRRPGGDALGGLDFRSNPQRGDTGGVAQGYGIFVYDGPRSYPELVVDLGDDLDANVSPTARNQVASLLGVPGGFILSRKPREMIRQLLLEQGAGYDPTGLTRWKPVRARLGKNAEIFLGGFEPRAIYSDTVTAPTHPAVVAAILVFREDYRRERLAGVPIEHLRRYTGSKCRSLIGELSTEAALAILPSEYAQDGWDTPRTTVTDSFTASSDGQLGDDITDEPWTELDGDWDVDSTNDDVDQVANQNNKAARCDTTLDDDDHYAQVTMKALPAAGRSLGVIARKDSSSTYTMYWASADQASSGTWKLGYYDGGVSGYGEIDSVTGESVSAGDKIKLEIDGTSLKVYKDTGGGFSEIPELANSNTAISGSSYSYCGLFSQKAGSTYDDFECADLAGGGDQDVFPSAATTVGAASMGTTTLSQVPPEGVAVVGIDAGIRDLAQVPAVGICVVGIDPGTADLVTFVTPSAAPSVVGIDAGIRDLTQVPPVGVTVVGIDAGTRDLDQVPPAGSVVIVPVAPTTELATVVEPGAATSVVGIVAPIFTLGQIPSVASAIAAASFTLLTLDQIPPVAAGVVGVDAGTRDLDQIPPSAAAVVGIDLGSVEIAQVVTPAVAAAVAAAGTVVYTLDQVPPEAAAATGITSVFALDVTPAVATSVLKAIDPSTTLTGAVTCFALVLDQVAFIFRTNRPRLVHQEIDDTNLDEFSMSPDLATWLSNMPRFKHKQIAE